MEKNNVRNLREYERVLYGKGLTYIAGIDEAGRGPLAGPVVAAAVVFSRDFEDAGIKDSKKLSAKKRETMAAVIKENALAWGIGLVDHEEIDEINILEATKKAMKMALAAADADLKRTLNSGIVRIEHVLIDAVRLEGLDISQTAIVKGDEFCFSIAAASILAKVHRDEIMVAMAEKYPGYGFEKHKGYGTRAHYEAIWELGLCPIHRRSFTKGL